MQNLNILFLAKKIFLKLMTELNKLSKIVKSNININSIEKMLQ